VFGLGMGLQETEVVESGAAGALGKIGVQAFRRVDVLPPTRNFSGDEAAKALDATGAQAGLFIAAASKGVTTSYVPPKYTSPGPITGTATTVGDLTVLNLYQAPGTYSPGYTVQEPNARYEAVLIDLKTGKAMWQAEITGQQDTVTVTGLAALVAAATSQGSSYDALAREMAVSSVAKLEKDGMLAIGAINATPNPNTTRPTASNSAQ
jgi:hypothetical protein